MRKLGQTNPARAAKWQIQRPNKQTNIPHRATGSKEMLPALPATLPVPVSWCRSLPVPSILADLVKVLEGLYHGIGVGHFNVLDPMLLEDRLDPG